MLYKVTGYYGTGFSHNNIPDSPELLEKCSKIDFPPVNIVQDTYLAELKIETTLEKIHALDYLKVGSMYYTVTGFQMIKDNAAVISLLPDFITTAGGVKDEKVIQFLDGIVERYMPPKSDDIYGKYLEEDALTAPSQPLVTDVHFIPESSITGAMKDVIASTVDLEKEAKARTLTSAEGQKVCFPEVEQAGSTTFKNGVTINGLSLYDSNNTIIQKHISLVRSLGIENGLIAHWKAPAGLIKTGNKSEVGYTSKTVIIDLPLEFQNVMNKRVLYGSGREYTLIDNTSNNSITYKPETINTKNGKPELKSIIDPYYNGGIYYKIIDKFSPGIANSIKSATWENLPILYGRAHGYKLNNVEYRAQQMLNKSNYEYDQAKINARMNSGFISQRDKLGIRNTLIAPGKALAQTGISRITGLAGKVQDLFTGEETERPAIDANKYTGAFARENERLDVIREGNKNAYYGEQEALTRRYEQQSFKDALQFDITNRVWANEINMPVNEFNRTHNMGGVYVIRIRPSKDDIKRMDILLNAYGYRNTRYIHPSMFNSRPKWNYVKMNGAQIINPGLPLLFREGMAAQLNSGIRVWHKLPSPNDYNTNNF